MDSDNPIFNCTEMDMCWDAYQRAFDAGTLQPDRADFDDWWKMFGTGVSWKSKREMVEAAWGKGVQNRNVQGTAGFDAYWQQILDSQPVTK